MAFVPPEAAKVGREIDIDIRGKTVPARQVPLPFYKRQQ
jgi:glycine cleavage system aminomethyltransferase T